MPTRGLGFSALMTALYSRLTGHALTSGYTFFNYVPINTPSPYHVIGKPIGRESASYKTRDREAEENIIQIDSWFEDDESIGLGDKACGDAMNNIMQAITSSPLTISGYTNPDTFLDSVQFLAVGMEKCGWDYCRRSAASNCDAAMRPSGQAHSVDLYGWETVSAGCILRSISSGR